MSVTGDEVTKGFIIIYHLFIKSYLCYGLEVFYWSFEFPLSGMLKANR